MCLHFDSDIKIDFIFVISNSLRNCQNTNKKYLDEKCIFNFELSLIDFFSSTEVEKSVLYIFCNNIFLKKVTIKQGYAFQKAKFGILITPTLESRSETPETPETPYPCFIVTFFKKILLQKRTDFEQYEIAQKTKLHLNKLHLKDCSVNDGVYLRIGFVSVKDFVVSNLKLPNNTELNIGDCHFENFQLTNFRNIGNFKLYKINILKIDAYEKDETQNNKKFQIDNTSIGKTDFQSINLSSFTEIKIFDNIFTEIDYTNIIWSDKVVGVEQYNNDTSKLSKQQDSYRTLKNVAFPIV
jgi:hypothetical protein